MDNLVTVRTFSSSIDFEFAKAYLESSGIECFGKDEIVNRAYLANVNGGVKLEVKTEQFDEAVRILTDGGYLIKEDLEPSVELKWIDKLLSRFRK